MKVIQLIFSLSAAGAERLLVDLSNSLSSYQIDVLVCTLLSDNVSEHNFYKGELYEKVRYHSMQFDRGFSLAKCWSLQNYLESESPDVVHCHLNVLPYVYYYALKHSNVKIVHTLHSVASYTVGGYLQVKLNRFFYRKIIVPVAISDICADSFCRLYGLKKPHIIENGRMPQLMPSPLYETVKAEIADLVGAANCKIFLHVGRFAPSKNQRRLILAFNELKKKQVAFKLLIVGDGFDSIEARHLKDLACEDIHFLGPKHNVRDYFICADAFCLSSDYEGMPITLIESFAYGATPIVTPAGGIIDIVENGKYGYVSNDFSVESYLCAIESYLANPIEKKVLTDYYNFRFKINRCAEKYIELYRA